ncbi:MAG: cytochrome c biogenesis protein ResB [Chloroflexota bacterium]|nr:cytochrome c biogenesis protein ResB [Chloroflexota bacterium]
MAAAAGNRRPSRPRSLRPADLLGALGAAAWRTLTSVPFAVTQIIVLAVAGLIGTLVRQIPSVALRDPAAYAREVAELHRRYDPLTILGVNVGPQMTDVFERLGFFRVFSAPWFTFLLTLLVVSIVVCTLDRTPRLWRSARHVRVAQPEPFFDLRLPQRARLEGINLDEDDLARLLHRRGFRVRRSADAADAGARFLYGDRNQYSKMATLLTHLGLILFLAGGAVTGALGYETVLFVGEGQTAPVQPVGTPHNLLVKNYRFEAPRRADGSFADFWTDLGVYQDGQLIARRTIRVNEPLSVAGFVFHQNTFGPAAHLEIRDPTGRLVWNAPVLLAGSLLQRPQGFLTIPDSNMGLLAILDRDRSGASVLGLSGISAAADGSARTEFLAAVPLGGTTAPEASAGYRITWTKAGAFSGLVVKSDPGQGLIWFAFLSLISGLLVTFYFPRRRVWTRVTDGRLELAMSADRYVNAAQEFGRLLDDVAAATGRRAGRPMRSAERP